MLFLSYLVCLSVKTNIITVLNNNEGLDFNIDQGEAQY